MAVLLTPPYLQFLDADGNPLAGGKVYTYAADTLTPKATFTTSDGDVEATNPVVLDASGRTTIWISGAYKFRIFDSADNFIRETDNISSFTATGESADAFFQTFSGDGTVTSFTLSEALGTDEKTLMVFVDGGGDEGYEIQNISAYTVSGTALTFSTAPATGTNNIYVFAPSRLAAAASASADAADTSANNAQAARDAAIAARDAALVAETGAETAETGAETAATNAATSETNAENYAAAYSGTSTTALLIETGSKVFTTQADKLWVDGQFLQIASAADASNYMNGTVTSYTGTTLTMDIETIGGSGTLADWNISISGVRGIQGIQGVQGVQGSLAGGTLTGALNWNTAQTIASAATTNLATATSNYVIVSGTTPITALGTIAQGAERVVRFSGVLTLTYNATTMILLSGANITTAVGDIATFVSEGSGNWRMIDYVREDGTALVIEADFYQDLGSITGSHTVDLSLGRTIKMTTTGNITLTFSNWLATGSQDAAYLIIAYGGAHTLTLSGITITTAGGAAYEPTASATDRIIIDTQNAGVNGTLNIVGQDYS